MTAAESFSLFIKKLGDNLKKPLPGKNAHRQMEALSARYLNAKPNEQTRRSAVLILLYPVENQICFPLILRRKYAGFHSGEISFPGGRYELADENLINTALREANEEIGLMVDEVQLLGTLTEIFIGPSNFLVLPVIGYIPYQPKLVPNAREVEHIFEAKFSYFSDSEIIGNSEILIPGDRVLTPHYDIEGNKIWGATAKMISELIAVASNN